MKTNINLLITFLLISSATFTQPGTLDETFGEGGKVLTQLNAKSYASILQADGKIITAGYASNEKTAGFFIARYLTDGKLDVTFGDSGYAITHFDFNGSVDDGYFLEVIHAVTIQPDGKIVAAGYGIHGYFYDAEIGPVYNMSFLVARYLPDGTLDSSFGGDGTVDTDFGKLEEAYAVVIQPDGKIIVGGSVAPAPGQPQELISDFCMVRYLSNGQLDQSFGNGGIVTTNFKDVDSETITSLAIQEDGKIVAGGKNPELGNETKSEFVLARYQTNGTLDASFGDSGVIKTDFGANGEQINDIVLQNDGKIVAAGISNNNSFIANMAIARYNFDGTPDQSFANEGRVSIKFEEGAARGSSVLLQSNGKILVSGYVFKGNIVDFALARCLPNGSLDSSFGINGKVVTDLGGYDYSYSSIVQDDGKIVLSGYSANDSTNYIALVRYNGDPVENPAITKIKTWINNEGLAWYSNNNSSIYYYSVEHSTNGTTFTEQKRVDADKVSALARQQVYNFALNNAQSNSYYRVAAVRKDGSTIYSNVLYYSGNESMVKVYPNPVKDVLHLEGLNTTSKTTLTVINAQGDIIKRISTNENNYNFNLSQLPRGTYNLQVEEGNQSNTHQFIKE